MKKYILKLFLMLLIFSCSSDKIISEDEPSNNTSTIPTNNADDDEVDEGSGNVEVEDSSNDWSIPVQQVIGAIGKDGIPSIDNPSLINIEHVDFLKDDDLVVGIIKNNEVRAYPHIILDWHEIVNDQIGNDFVTINYCPLTGTAFAWESKSNGIKGTFGVSGFLYNANLILYDRNTDSHWSQLKLECVNGPLIYNKPTLISVVETDWKTWKTLYPETKVLSRNTGFSWPYGVSSPYGDYATNNNFFIYRPEITNSKLPSKERVYALIDDNQSKVYQFSNFNGGAVIKDSFNGQEYLVIGNENLMYGFKLEGDHTNLLFEYALNDSSALFKDNEGNTWSIFGKALSGPRTGEVLTPATSVMSYWFAIAAFYPNPEIYSTP